ncbi:MAG: ATP-dependent protease [Gammaproteobacteria bacterium]|nr:MAG: ATP-dependent protease [Gammaproteobacteria bacterium]
MSLATTLCRASLGIEAPLVTVETHLANGLPAFNIVGLPEKAVQEARDRVRSALINSGFEFPSRRITVNLAPADIPKQGSRFDLAIAIGILVASRQLPHDGLVGLELFGELTLGGGVRPVTGILPAAAACAREGHRLLLPEPNAAEAGLVSSLEILPTDSLLQVAAHLTGRETIPPFERKEATLTREPGPDLADVRGQPQARRALEIAAAGRHNLLMMGPPGTGKSMLAARLPGILPPMTEQEALETAAIHSVAGVPVEPSRWRQRPFRSPHHTSSGVALVGGSGVPRPGEISLAHNGVLYLDELPEFDARVLEVLREPMETGKIVIARAARSAEFPARFQLVAAMNPCRCGYLNDEEKRCVQCTPQTAERYQGRISGPLRDRIDIQIEVPAVPVEQLLNTDEPRESSTAVRERVTAAWRHQMARQGCSNAELAHAALERHCPLAPPVRSLLSEAIDRLGLSARAYHRILRVARTIADLAQSDVIEATHMSEAIGYRRLDRGG